VAAENAVFKIFGKKKDFANGRGEDTEEYILRLDLTMQHPLSIVWLTYSFLRKILDAGFAPNEMTADYNKRQKLLGRSENPSSLS